MTNLNLYSRIEYDGGADAVVWKHPVEDFNFMSRLYVKPDQIAYLYNDGILEGPFGPGEYDLETRNYPILSDVMSILGDGRPRNKCQVIFVNLSHYLGGKWGTGGVKLRLSDSEYEDLPVSIGISGGMAFTVVDPEILLHKLFIGGERECLTKNDLTVLIRQMAMPLTKENFIRIIKESKIDLFQVDAHLSQISAELYSRIEPLYETYGLSLTEYYLDEVQLDGDLAKIKEQQHRETFTIKDMKIDRNLARMEAETNAEVKLINKRAEAEMLLIDTEALLNRYKMLGIDYKTDRLLEIFESMASSGSGGEDGLSLLLKTITTVLAMKYGPDIMDSAFGRDRK